MVAAGIGCALLSALRWIRSRSVLVWRIVAAGVIGRVLLGLTLFWASYLDLPILRSFHSGDGFWVLMPDARAYYELAMSGVDHGLRSIASGGPSPFFVTTLALWMELVGVSPAAALYLNLCLYVSVIVLFVWAFKPANDWRRDLACITGVAAFSFSPVSLIDGTQALKDDTFTALIALMCIGAWLLLGALVYADRTPGPRFRTMSGGACPGARDLCDPAGPAAADSVRPW
jgi:hypothetical protein